MKFTTKDTPNTTKKKTTKKKMTLKRVLKKTRKETRNKDTLERIIMNLFKKNQSPNVAPAYKVSIFEKAAYQKTEKYIKELKSYTASISRQEKGVILDSIKDFMLHFYYLNKKKNPEIIKYFILEDQELKKRDIDAILNQWENNGQLGANAYAKNVLSSFKAGMYTQASKNLYNAIANRIWWITLSSYKFKPLLIDVNAIWNNVLEGQEYSKLFKKNEDLPSIINADIL